MSAFNVLVTGTNLRRIKGEPAARLEGAGCALRGTPFDRAATSDELLPLLRDVDAVLASTDDFSRRVLSSAPRLKIVSRFGVGFDTIDVAAATEVGVWVTTTPGTNEHSVADHTLTLILALARHLVPMANQTRAGKWERTAGIELGGATLGLIGFGRIGRQVALRACAFGMEVLIYDVYQDVGAASACGARYAPLDEVLARADVISLHAPATPQTRGLINARTLAQMKPTAYLINTARGELVDEDALRDALRGGTIAGAGLDVFSREPPDPADPLLALPNVLATAHVAGITTQSVARMADLSVENILAVLRGARPPFPINEPPTPGPEPLARIAYTRFCVPHRPACVTTPTKGNSVSERMRSVMNDPSFAYGQVYGPFDTLEKSITLLQTRLAKVDPERLTLEYLDQQYQGLFAMLVDHGFCTVTAYTLPTLSKDVWLRHQLSRIERYRD